MVIPNLGRFVFGRVNADFFAVRISQCCLEIGRRDLENVVQISRKLAASKMSGRGEMKVATTGEDGAVSAFTYMLM